VEACRDEDGQEESMTFNAPSYYSDIAQSGPPLFFPDPPVPVTFNFDQGIPAEETFPLDDLIQLHSEVLGRDQGRALEYITQGWDEAEQRIKYLSTYEELVMGNRVLRTELTRWLGGKNDRRDLSPDGIILTSGSVQAIGLAINAYIDEGDGVLVESASFPYALRYFELRKARIYPVAMDRDGLDADDMERQLQAMRADGVRPKMLYIVSTYSCPTGYTTSLDRRRRIIELAQEHNFVVLEDAVYSDLRLSGDRVPSILSMDPDGRVIQSHSFSKVVTPGLRLGWMTGAPEAIGALAAVRQDLGVSQWTARVMAEFVSQGMLDRHIEKILPVYRRKRDIAAAAMMRHCAPYVSFDIPDGGFYLWLRLSDEVAWEKVQVVAANAGVAFRPGERFMNEATHADAGHYLRLAFSHVGEHELERGIAALGQAIRDSIG
jgi:2-aminoadipate transaminase